MNPANGSRLATLLFLGLGVWLAARETAPPSLPLLPALPESPGDSGVFSVARAMADVRELAVRPHPLGSAEHERVLEWLLGRVRELGLEPEVQSASVQTRSGRFAAVQNVVARIPGRQPEGRAVLLCAHYDSVATSPGAADDAAGVAALLEVLRVLGSAKAHRNDIILLITDGEEAGLLGARAFVEHHPLAPKVGVVLNLEARGHRGPSILFETSDGNANLIPLLARLEDPVTSSLTDEVYRRLPNDTDLTIFMRAGMAGLNFAFIGGRSHYHTLLDTPENLDPRSLNHQGQSVLALTRVLADRDLEALDTSRNRIYFSVLRSAVVHYPAALAWPLTGLAVLFLLLVLRCGFRRRRISTRALWVGVLVQVASTLLAAGLAWGLTALLSRQARETALVRAIESSGADPIMGGLLCLSLAATLIVLARLRIRSNREGLWGGALLIWAACDLLLTVWLPDGSYLLTWPLLFASLGLLILLCRPHRRRPGPGLQVACAAAVLPGLVLMVPLIWLLFQAVGLRLAPFVICLLGLLLGLLTPQLILLVPGGRRAIPVLALLAGSALIGSSILTTDID